MTKTQTPTNTRAGRIHESSVDSQVFSTRPVNFTFAASSSATRPGSSTRAVTNGCGPAPARFSSSSFSLGSRPSSPSAGSVPVIVCLSRTRLLTLPFLASALNSL